MTRKAATRETPEKEVNERAMLIFCAALAEAATVSEACAEAGIHRCTAYRWKESDEEFAQAWDDALDAGTDILEAEATRRAVHGVEEPVVYQGQLTPIYERDEFGSIRMAEVEVPDGQGGTRRVTQPVQAVDAQGNLKWLTIRKPSDTLMIFMLKARRPEKYRERIAAEVTGKDGKDLPVAPAGVLVVPGLATDPAAWSGAVQQAALPAGEG